MYITSKKTWVFISLLVKNVKILSLKNKRNLIQFSIDRVAMSLTKEIYVLINEIGSNQNH